jgi:hypothetical protein
MSYCQLLQHLPNSRGSLAAEQAATQITYLEDRQYDLATLNMGDSGGSGGDCLGQCTWENYLWNPREWPPGIWLGG